MRGGGLRFGEKNTKAEEKKKKPSTTTTNLSLNSHLFSCFLFSHHRLARQGPDDGLERGEHGVEGSSPLVR